MKNATRIQTTYDTIFDLYEAEPDPHVQAALYLSLARIAAYQRSLVSKTTRSARVNGKAKKTKRSKR